MCLGHFMDNRVVVEKRPYTSYQTALNITKPSYFIFNGDIKIGYRVCNQQKENGYS